MFRSWFRITLAAMLLAPISGIQPAHADSPIFLSNSVEDRKQPANMNYRYEVIGMSVIVMKDNPGTIIFKVNLGSSVSENSFMPYGGSVPVLQVKVLNRLTDYKDLKSDVILQAPTDYPYKRDTPIDATVSVYSDPKVGAASGRKDVTALCKPKTWMDSGATSNWVAFSIDRNCADINDQFWTTTFIDSDKFASSYILDSKYSPADPMYVDMRTVPRPPKMLEQTVTFTSTPPTINLEFPNTSVSAVSSQGLPLSFASLTPTICQLTPGGNTAAIKAITAGVCKIDVWAEGTSTVNPSPHIQTSFTINPIVMVSQNFSYYQPTGVMVGDDDFDINVSASSGLPVTLQSLDASVCFFKDPVNSPRTVSIIGAGTCQFRVSQAGSAKYYAASGIGTFYVEPKPAPQPEATKSASPSPRPKPSATKVETLGGNSYAQGNSSSVTTQQGANSLNQQSKNTKTIKCQNRTTKTIKPVTAVNPVCPLGYKLYKP